MYSALKIVNNSTFVIIKWKLFLVHCHVYLIFIFQILECALVMDWVPETQILGFGSVFFIFCQIFDLFDDFSSHSKNFWIIIKYAKKIGKKWRKALLNLGILTLIFWQIPCTRSVASVCLHIWIFTPFDVFLQVFLEIVPPTSSPKYLQKISSHAQQKFRTSSNQPKIQLRKNP